MNDLTTPISIGEVDWLLLGMGESSEPLEAPALIVSIYSSWSRFCGLGLFWFRSLGVLLFLASLFFFLFKGRRIFGLPLMTSLGLVAASSWLLTNVAKFALSDNWLFAAQLLNTLALVFSLKERKSFWQLLFWISFLVGAAIHPLWMSLYSSIFWFWLYFRHPQGQQLGKPYFWAMAF